MLPTSPPPLLSGEVLQNVLSDDKRLQSSAKSTSGRNVSPLTLSSLAYNVVPAVSSTPSSTSRQRQPGRCVDLAAAAAVGAQARRARRRQQDAVIDNGPVREKPTGKDSARTVDGCPRTRLGLDVETITTKS